MPETYAEIAGRLAAVLNGSGLFLRGGFHPAADEDMPACADGVRAATVLLIGNAGPALWRAFGADRSPAGHREADDPHPLDRWIMGHVRRAAAAIGATPIDPMRSPHPPIQRWARRAESVHASPLGLLIHPRYGLWHVYRGALLLPRRVELPAPTADASPCDGCRTKPCLRACPVEAFQPDGFRMGACADHVESDGGGACRRLGCLARRACPVGRDWRYPDDACAYHMRAVVKTVRRMQRSG